MTRSLAIATVLLGLAWIPSQAHTQVTMVIPADPAGFGLIPEPRNNCEINFRSRSVTFTVPSPSLFVTSVSLSMSLNHPRIGHLAAMLTSPDGARHWLFYRPDPRTNGGASGVVGTYEFDDGATGDLRAAMALAVVPPSAYPPSFGPNVDVSRTMNATFSGRLASGVWTLSVQDQCPGSFGTIFGARLVLTGTPVADARAEPSTLGAIPQAAGGPQEPGPPRDVTFAVPPGRGRVQKVRVSATMMHPRVGDLVARLIAPNGASQVLFGYTGATTAASFGSIARLDGRYEFRDDGVYDWWAIAADFEGRDMLTGSYTSSQLGGPGGTGAVTSMNAAFAGAASAGTWTLRLTDGAANAGGSISAAALVLETDTTPSTRDDAYTSAYLAPTVVAAPGVLANDTDNFGGAMSSQLVSGPSSGALSLSPSGAFTYTPAVGFAGTDTFTYRATNTTGPGNVATVSITVAAPTTVQPPTAFRVSSMTGHQVTLRWTPLAVGPAPADFVIEGGVAPGQVLGGFATGGPLPIVTTSLPTGAFYLRVHAVDAAGRRSAPSNEIPVFVNTPAVPSAPASLTGTVNGNAFGLSWRNTFAGGVPTSLQLTVSGAAVATLPVPLGETFSFAGVPAGTYTFRVGAVNPTGTSVESPPVTLTFPSGCTAAPNPPANVLAYAVGNAVHVVWDPPSTGAAPASYVLHVGGSFTGTFSLPTRNFSSPAPPGTYSFSLSTVNACGSSAQTSPQTVFVP